MSIERTLEKVSRDCDRGDYGKARDRLHSLIASYPDNLSLRRKLGDIYRKMHYPAMTGRYWYLEAEKTPEMQQACTAFEKSCGNDPLQILLALKFRGDPNALHSDFARQVLTSLQKEVESRYNLIIDHRKPAKGNWQAANNRERFAVRAFAAGCILALLITAGLALIGLQTFLSWIF